MDYKTILVHMDAGRRCAARLRIAIRLAERFDAHLVALHALRRTEMLGYLLAEAGATVLARQQRLLGEIEARGETAFRRAVSAAGLPSAEWRASAEDAVHAVALHGRYADLLVLGQPDADDNSGVDRDFVERVVVSNGRPALVVPYTDSFESIGRRIMVAWNGTREATHAVTNALPALKRAELVHVITFNPDAWAHGDDPGTDVALYLARHGVKVEVMKEWVTEIDVGNKMLSLAADLGTDLIVMGAYGHWRLTEWAMGGVTRTLLDSMTVPVMMSH